MAITKFFDFLNIFFDKKEIPTQEEIDKFCNQYMLNVTFSCDSGLVELAHEMSKLKISNKEYFDCLYYGLPKQKRYIQYNAKKVKADQDVKYVMEYYNCSQQTAKEYVSLMTEEELKSIADMFEKRGIIKK